MGYDELICRIDTLFCPILHRAPRISTDVEGRACRMGVSGDLVIADHVLRRALAVLALQLGVIVPGGDVADDEVVGPVQYKNLASRLSDCGEVNIGRLQSR